MSEPLSKALQRINEALTMPPLMYQAAFAAILIDFRDEVQADRPKNACKRCGSVDWVCAPCNGIVTGDAAEEIRREIREGTPDTPERIAAMKRADEAFARSGIAIWGTPK